MSRGGITFDRYRRTNRNESRGQWTRDGGSSRKVANGGRNRCIRSIGGLDGDEVNPRTWRGPRCRKRRGSGFCAHSYAFAINKKPIGVALRSEGALSEGRDENGVVGRTKRLVGREETRARQRRRRFGILAITSDYYRRDRGVSRTGTIDCDASDRSPKGGQGACASRRSATRKCDSRSRGIARAAVGHRNAGNRSTEGS